VGIPGYRLDASLFALGGFLVGAWLAGTVAPRLHGTRRGLILRVTVTAELVLVAIATSSGSAPAATPATPVSTPSPRCARSRWAGRTWRPGGWPFRT